MEGSFLDAGILDIVWFLVKVGIAIMVIFLVLSAIMAAGETAVGGSIILILLFCAICLAVFGGLWYVVVFIASYFIPEELAKTYATFGVGAFAVLGFLGWAADSAKEKRERNAIKEARISEKETYRDIGADEKYNNELLDKFLEFVSGGDEEVLSILRANTEMLDFNDGVAIIETTDILPDKLHTKIKESFNDFFEEDISLQLVTFPS